MIQIAETNYNRKVHFKLPEKVKGNYIKRSYEITYQQIQIDNKQPWLSNNDGPIQHIYINISYIYLIMVKHATSIAIYFKCMLNISCH